MKQEIIQLLTERVALINEQSSAGDYSANVDPEGVTYLMDAYRENENVSNEEFDEDVDSVLADFDFDIEERTEFDVFMTVRYYWRDWNALYTEIF